MNDDGECVAWDIWKSEGLQMLSHRPGHCDGWLLGMRASAVSRLNIDPVNIISIWVE